MTRQGMKATARRTSRHGFGHEIAVRDHRLVVDEPREAGGEDEGPSPQELLAASLASCTAVTMEMYAERKGWDIGQVEVECEFTAAERGSPSKFAITLRVPDACSDEQLERLRIIAAKCPIHRTLDGEVMFEERVERATRAAT